MTRERFLVSISLVLSTLAAGVRAEGPPADKEGTSAVVAGAPARQIPAFPTLERRIPCFRERLTNSRWQVRYSLVLDLTGRDPETKRALEVLIGDESDAVARQAVGMYLNHFTNVRKDLIRPRLLAHSLLVALPEAMEKSERKALIDACLGRGPYPFDFPEDLGGAPPPLNISEMNNPHVVKTITVVGILGERSDSAALEPFLESENDYVVLNTAKALLRLGDRESAPEALRRMAEKDPKEHLYYITESLAVLREMGEEDWRDRAEEALAEVDAAGDIQPNWVNGLVLLTLEGECGG